MGKKKKCFIKEFERKFFGSDFSVVAKEWTKNSWGVRVRGTAARVSTRSAASASSLVLGAQKKKGPIMKGVGLSGKSVFCTRWNLFWWWAVAVGNQYQRYEDMMCKVILRNLTLNSSSFFSFFAKTFFMQLEESAFQKRIYGHFVHPRVRGERGPQHQRQQRAGRFRSSSKPGVRAFFEKYKIDQTWTRIPYRNLSERKVPNKSIIGIVTMLNQ